MACYRTWFFNILAKTFEEFDFSKNLKKDLFNSITSCTTMGPSQVLRLSGSVLIKQVFYQKFSFKLTTTLGSNLGATTQETPVTRKLNLTCLYYLWSCWKYIYSKFVNKKVMVWSMTYQNHDSGTLCKATAAWLIHGV